MKDDTHFGKKLKEYLEGKGITNSWLAEKINVKPPSINEYIKADNPRRETKTKILSALGITEDEFYAFGTGKEVGQREEERVKDKEQVVQITMTELQFFIQQTQKVNELNAELLKMKDEKIKELEKHNRVETSPAMKH